MENQHKNVNTEEYVIEIKIVEERSHGWSAEGAAIPPVERIEKKKSGSYLMIEGSTHNMGGLYSEEDQKAENMIRSDFILKEGFRLFVYSGSPDVVDFTPERRLVPISGEEFPMLKFLPLEVEKLSVGESFKIEPRIMDASVVYTVTLLSINK